VKEYLGKEVKVKIDRPLGSKHPEYGFYYPINYGYIPNTIADDGEEIDVYVLGVHEPIREYEGKVIGIIHRKDDCEDKLVVAKEISSYGKEAIKALTEFQERFFDIEIITFEFLQQSIRNTVKGIIRRGEEILALEEKDVDGKAYYHLPGGGIEFLEKSEDAIRREIKEELQSEIEEIIHRITIENFFDINGIKAHEICKVYEVRMKQEFYKIEEYEVTADIIPSIAKWVKVDEFKARRKTFYPVELIEYL